MEKISLFEIDEKILKLISLDESEIVDSDTGEILIDIFEELEKLNIKREEKIINIARYVDDLEREQELIKKKAEELKARAESKKNRAQRLRQYLADSMLKLDTKKIEDATVTVKLNSSKSVKINDEKLIPDEYLNKIVEVKPDKRRLLAELKKGTRITGVELSENHSVTVR